MYPVIITKPDGRTLKGKAAVYSRDGSKSPQLVMVYYRGKQYTPFAMRKKNWTINTFQLMLHRIYGPYVKDMIYNDNPFLRLALKSDGWKGAYLPAPIAYTLPKKYSGFKKPLPRRGRR